MAKRLQLPRLREADFFVSLQNKGKESVICFRYIISLVNIGTLVFNQIRLRSYNSILYSA
jgi:hypothetical protein